MHSVTDGQTDGQMDRRHYDANNRLYSAQYDRLKQVNHALYKYNTSDVMY